MSLRSEARAAWADRPTASNMETHFQDFERGQIECNGDRLSRTLSPSLSSEQLRAIWKSCNHHDVRNVIKRTLQSTEIGRAVSREEIQGWAEVYFSYWKAVGELVAIQESSVANGRVSLLLLHS